jgi:hypothetical protein
VRLEYILGLVVFFQVLNAVLELVQTKALRKRVSVLEDQVGYRQRLSESGASAMEQRCHARSGWAEAQVKELDRRLARLEGRP